MSTGHLPEGTYAVLGLVDKVPASSGYDLVAVAGQSLAYFWPVSPTLMYKELDRLTGLGWVAATRVEQTRAPSKSLYRTTDPGRQALADWIARPVSTMDTVRSGFLLRVFFAFRLEPHRLQSLLDARRALVEAQRGQYEGIVDKLAAIGSAEARAGRLTALYGLRTAEAQLGWLDEISDLVRKDPLWNPV